MLRIVVAEELTLRERREGKSPYRTFFVNCPELEAWLRGNPGRWVNEVVVDRTGTDPQPGWRLFEDAVLGDLPAQMRRMESRLAKLESVLVLPSKGDG
jgi:hypothetical protein